MLFVVFAGLVSFAFALWPRLGWRVAEAFIDDSVPALSTKALAQQLEDSPRPLLLDTRSAEEYAVSHIPGAIHFPPGTPIGDRIRSAHSIVAYCSVGVRSAAEVARLRAAGVEAVHNLEGSLFRWALEGRPLVDREGPTNVVHPYDAVWGRLLPARLRSDAPR